MRVVRADYEAKSGKVLDEKIIFAIPDTYCEFLALLFRSGYLVSSRIAREDSWLPALQKRTHVSIGRATKNRMIRTGENVTSKPVRYTEPRSL